MISLGLSIAAIFVSADIKWNVEIVSTAIILAFVGILATFVVISNYAQVKELERKVTDSEGRIGRKVADLEGKIENKVNELSVKQGEIEKMERDILKLKTQTFVALVKNDTPYNKSIQILDFILKENFALATVNEWLASFYEIYDREMRYEEDSKQMETLHKKAVLVQKRYPSAEIGGFFPHSFSDFLNELKEHADGVKGLHTQ
jgi:hypothetical protein